jgi:hypothetical protein
MKNEAKKQPATQESRQEFRVIVAGSRHFNDYDKLKRHLDVILANKLLVAGVTIISGCARGADTLGERYASERHLPVLKFPANWSKFGKSAGYKRNLQMADGADAVVAFLAPDSRGTAHMISVAKQRNLLLRVIDI